MPVLGAHPVRQPAVELHAPDLMLRRHSVAGGLGRIIEYYGPGSTR